MRWWELNPRPPGYEPGELATAPHRCQKSYIATFKKAVETIFGHVKPASPPKSQPTNGPTPEQWQRGALAQPTQRGNAPEPKGVEKAVHSVANLMRERGIEVEGMQDVDTHELDGFPE